MTESVYQQVLGPKFAELAPELRDYFAGDANGHPGIGTGVFEVAGSRRRFLWPALSFLAWQRILFPEFGRDVPFKIVNTPTADGGLHAIRTFHLPRRDRPLEDTMRVVDGRLHDYMGRSSWFEVRMVLSITDGLLQMRSDRQWLNLGRLRLRLPQFASVTVAESWRDGKQHVDIRLRSPLIGEWFRYAGSFNYRHEAR